MKIHQRPQPSPQRPSSPPNAPAEAQPNDPAHRARDLAIKAGATVLAGASLIPIAGGIAQAAEAPPTPSPDSFVQEAEEAGMLAAVLDNAVADYEAGGAGAVSIDYSALVGAEAGSKEALTELDRLKESAAWQALSASEQEQAETIYRALPNADLLEELLAKPELMRSTDKDGRTVLEGLAELATQPLHPKLVEGQAAQREEGASNWYSMGTRPGGTQDPVTGDESPEAYTRARLLDGLIMEMLDPGEINQSSFGTCGPTSMQFSLARRDPGEYVRLVGGLTGAEGRATMRGGATLKLQQEYLTQRDNDKRSLPESVFQGAMMEFAGLGRYNADTDVQDLLVFESGGIDVIAASELLGQLFGREYAPLPESAARALLERSEARSAEDLPILVGIKVTSGGGHFLTFDRIEDGRIYLRNPWGGLSGEYSRVNYEKQLGARVENAETGLVSMSIEEFQSHGFVVVAPVTEMGPELLVATAGVGTVTMAGVGAKHLLDKRRHKDETAS